MSKLSPQELAQEFERFVNGASDDKKKEFVEHFQRMHRCNAQSAFGVVLKIVDAVASPDYGRDGRNEESHKRAKMMVTGLKNEVVKDLKLTDEYYWRGNRAKEWVFGENYDFTILPLI